jgi:hypothetical protein
MVGSEPVIENSFGTRRGGIFRETLILDQLVKYRTEA